MKKHLFYLLLVFGGFAINYSCNVRKAKQDDTMKNYSDGDYAQQWKTIDSLSQKGLPKSALNEVNALYRQAKTDNRPAQIIKTLIYRTNYMSQLEEEGLVAAINDLRRELTQTNMPARAVLQSMLAELYEDYLNQNQWRLQDRTEVQGFQPEDIQTWSMANFIDQSADYYLASLAHPGLDTIAIAQYGPITTEEKNTDGLRPTLYDFLAHRALDFFLNDRSFLTEPVYTFEITDKNAFAAASEFAQLNFQTTAKESRKYQAVLIFQELIRKHLNDKHPTALIDVDLKRLRFMKDQSAVDQKLALYESALKSLRARYPDHTAAAEVLAALAELYIEQAADYEAGPDEEGKWDYKTAHAYCQEAIELFPQSYGADQCRNLLARIQQKQLSLQTELVNMDQKPILAQIEYRNVNKVFVKLVQFDEKAQQSYNQLEYEKQLGFLNQLPAIQTSSYDLPNDGDFRLHQTEIKIDPLAYGTYLLMVSDGEKFSDQQHQVSFVNFQVSDIFYWVRQQSDLKSELVVAHRETGEPLQGVKAEFLLRTYNSSKRDYDYSVAMTAESDRQGMIEVTLPERQSYQVRLTKGSDQLQLENYLSSYYGREPEQQPSTMEFFLDRSIYRPGQTLYFKGIVLRKNQQDIPQIVKNQSVEVLFMDANGSESGRKTFRTNEYGTLNGSFVTPSSGMLGTMWLEARSTSGDQLGSKYFNVEEYKRPKFEVTFQPIEGSFRLNDEVTAKGSAKAYAGSNVDGAQVSFRVIRETIFPWWGWGWRSFPPRRETVEITNGVTTTDAQGNFEISFPAIPDPTTDSEKKPQFNYRIYADVVDITGETQSAETSVSVGYIALSVALDLGDKVNSDSLSSIVINTKNLNGNFEPAAGALTIAVLDAPEQVYQNRLWSKPDMPLMSQNEFKTAFPHFPYKEEDQMQNWPVNRQIFQAKFDTRQSKSVQIQKGSLPPGAYLLTLETTDKFGEEVELKHFFKVYDLDMQKVPTNEAHFYVQEKKSYQPGQTVLAWEGTAYDRVPLLFEVEQGSKITEHRWTDLSGLDGFKIPVLESDRGGFYYQVNFVKNNRAYTHIERIDVPWSNKELNIAYETFRDKLLPGQEEEWRIKISGADKDRVAAEMLASMYDASLDQFLPHQWNFSPYPQRYYTTMRLSDMGISVAQPINRSEGWQPMGVPVQRMYRQLNWFDRYSMYRDGIVLSKSSGIRVEAAEMEEMQVGAPVANDAATGGDQVAPPSPPADPEVDLSDVPVRTNLNETVFFFPDLRTDAEGNILIRFKMNEALTRWKFQAFAHTQDLAYALTQKEIVTQKDLMVLPNPPRFVREGDVIEFTAKVSNLTKEVMNGTAELKLFDAVNMQPVDRLLGNNQPQLSFSAKAGQSDLLSWRLTIPKGEVMALTHRVVARAGNFSDGEESSLPVLTNRMLVTESHPLAVRGGETKTFVFESLKKADQSSTLTHHQYTLEFTSNPAWYAVQALPYIMEYPYECTEQIFNRLYANSLATTVANSHPKIKRIFEQWKTMDADALESNLSKNQELKSALLEETPWVLAARSEAEQKQNIALLFDLNNMAAQTDKAITQLKDRQLGNGGFAWFPGGPDNWYITQYLVEGMGHLSKLGVLTSVKDGRLMQINNNAVRYIDQRLVEQYQELKKNLKNNKAELDKDHLNDIAIHYLYARSFFPDIDLASREMAEAKYYYLAQAKKYWLGKGLYQEAMIAMALWRNSEKSTVTDILKSLQERSLNDEELGMYWKYNNGYYWYQAPIETQALMIELFGEVGDDQRAVEDLKIWLLKNKQTNHWQSTKATAAAVYALLMGGDNWLLDDQQVNIEIGGRKIDQNRIQKEAGTGYFKTSWNGEEVRPKMSTIQIQNPNTGIAWGAAYWQYFEQLDKIEMFEETPLTLKKQLFKVVNTPGGPQLAALKEGAVLQPGDKLKVRIELRVDRPMEYVHMKDMRASGLEPINVLSSYKWQGGLGYYESTRDASTNFFMSYLPVGTHVFEYPLRVVHQGDFSNGVTTIQCMYAPEFTSHSEGIRIKVENLQ